MKTFTEVVMEYQKNSNSNISKDVGFIIYARYLIHLFKMEKPRGKYKLSIGIIDALNRELSLEMAYYQLCKNEESERSLSRCLSSNRHIEVIKSVLTGDFELLHDDDMVMPPKLNTSLDDSLHFHRESRMEINAALKKIREANQ